MKFKYLFLLFLQHKALNMKTRFQKIERKLFGFLSFSAALFVFQACYGAP